MNDKLGYVYFIQNRGFVKIGYTMSDPTDRMKSLFPSNHPSDEESILLHSIKTTFPYKREQEFHEYYADKRMKGEWFKLTDEDIGKIKQISGSITYEQRREKIVALEEEHKRLEEEDRKKHTDGMRIINFDDRRIDIQQEIDDLQVWIEDNYISIDTGHYEYFFEISRCSKYEDILHWVKHLCEKRWMTTTKISNFIFLACRYHNLKPY